MNVAEQVLACFAKGMRYQAAADECGLDKNKMYATTQKLIKARCLRKVAYGKYEVINGVAPPSVSPTRTYRKRDEVVKLPAPVPPPPPPEESLDTIATTLLGKVGYLQPLLLLHKDLFAEIQALTLKIVERLNDAQPRTLSETELNEWRELQAIKQEAKTYAARHSR